MSKESRISKAARPRFPAQWVLLVLAAFALGSTVTWLILRGSTASRPPANNIEAVQTPVEKPPDTSRLAPAEASATLANWNYDRRNWPHAIEHYHQAIALGLDNPDIRTDLGNCYRFTAQPEKALEQYATAQRQNPQHENSLLNTAGLYEEVLGDPAKAAAAWREYLRRFPGGAAADRATQYLASAEQREGRQTDLLKQFINEDVPGKCP